MSKHRSRYGDFFFNINSLILSFINDQLHFNWSQEIYLRKMFSWHKEFCCDLETIENSISFWDDYEQKEYSRDNIPSSTNVSNIINYTLKIMFNEKGLLQFETNNKKYVFHYWDWNNAFFVNKRNGHYSDVDFYQNAGTCIESLKKLFDKVFNEESFKQNGYINTFRRILFVCLNCEYKKKIGYYDSEQKKEIGNFILQKYGIFGLLYLVLFYSLNGNIPTIQKSSPPISPNIYMSSKYDIEHLYSLKERCEGSVRIVMVCYTGTSFLANETISTAYDYQWFKYYKSLIDTVQIDLVLVSPNSNFIEEMINFKMKPRTIKKNIQMRNLIKENIKRLLKLLDKDVFPTSNINLYFVNFALTCSYFQCIFPENQKERNNIKVDIYLPNFSGYTKDGNGDYVIPDDQPSDAELRQSFDVKSGSKLYGVFSRNIEDIISHSERVIIKSEIEDKYKDMMNEIIKGDVQ